MLQLTTAPTTVTDVRDLLDEELSNLDGWTSGEHMDWCASFILAALEEAPGEADDDDVEDTTADALDFLLIDHPLRLRTLAASWIPGAAGRAWVRIRNGSAENLAVDTVTAAARDLGRIRLG